MCERKPGGNQAENQTRNSFDYRTVPSHRCRQTMTTPTPHPTRKKLPHAIPAWVASDRAVFFVTICALPRGGNHLCSVPVAESLWETMLYRERIGQWTVRLCVLMPDHLHALLMAPPEPGLRAVIESWKRYTAKRFAIAWQADSFDHRLRTEESYNEKACYMRMNPVRQGLVRTPEAWPFTWPQPRE